MDEDSTAVLALVEAAAAGDERAWAQIVERYAPLVMAVLAGFRVFGSDAQDVSQTVWLRLVEHLEDLREPRALPRWLATTTRNECLRLLRTRRRTVAVDPIEHDRRRQADGTDRAGGPEPDEDLLRSERIQAVLEALGGLSGSERALLSLLVADPPPPYKEIARRLGMRVGSIGPTRQRILAKLRGSPALTALYESDSAGNGDGGGDRDARELVG